MTDDLVQRLREDVFYGDARLANMDKHNPLHMDAADRIEQLEREKAVVSDLWEQQKEIALDYLADCNKAAHLIEAQAAEIKWLRDLLNHVANEADHDCETMWITDIINAALEARGFEIREKNNA
jgi:hypothetical protein